MESRNKSTHVTASPITIEDVKRFFDKQTVQQLARLANLPAGADLCEFGESTHIAATIYLEMKARLSAPALGAAIRKLYQLNNRAEHGNDKAARTLALATAAMPADLRQWLLSVGPPHYQIPTPEEILSPVERARAIEQLRLFVLGGGRMQVGRKRAGKQNSRTFKPELRAPLVVRGRPRDLPVHELMQALAIAYAEATGELPPRTVHFDAEIRGPFPDFMHGCFELVGVSTGNLTRLLNQYGAAQPGDRSKPRISRRPRRKKERI